MGIACYIKKRIIKNCDINNIVYVKQQNMSPALYEELQCCQPTTSAVKHSFFILSKVLDKGKQFVLEIVENYLLLYYNEF